MVPLMDEEEPKVEQAKPTALLKFSKATTFSNKTSNANPTTKTAPFTLPPPLHVPCQFLHHQCLHLYQSHH
ncbi:hypothetical protein CCACVL1_03612 [Corchorus capsularis]|uniref:Uncharacterized protein n=1 Tax=Corchorus capsularis TaxID=210143 RepID=A0A1R3JY83_COCAP|nr:hypothetical protein CCACVL1_03612 [Corchorus capsularis]